eukprot:TRINITY_DN11452_c0_g1_i1.p1 TRINITY_DN11452_c0_g1~~TRINITY_DN11452_c0_g1_i1.p1  ORF type:complete len:378 (+),score=54.46 TRINITY_DN11452_c0_g1_i1:37-1134(+)
MSDGKPAKRRAVPDVHTSQPRALPVEAFPLETNPETPPSTAEEYLLRVRQEAQRLPDVVVARSIPQLPPKRPAALPECLRGARLPAIFVPSKLWREPVLHRFQQLRDYLATLEATLPSRPVTPLQQVKHGGHIKAHCFGHSSSPPTVTELLSLDAVKVEWLLTQIVRITRLADDIQQSQNGCLSKEPAQVVGLKHEPVEDHKVEPELTVVTPVADADAVSEDGEGEELTEEEPGAAVLAGDKSDEEELEDGATPLAVSAVHDTPATGDDLRYQRIVNRLTGRPVGTAVWLYSLLARIDLPLLPQTQSVLQQLLQELCASRLRLHDWDPEVTLPGTERGIATISLLITVIGAYFKQANPELLPIYS